jgi:hypothetical protein
VRDQLDAEQRTLGDVVGVRVRRDRSVRVVEKMKAEPLCSRSISSLEELVEWPRPRGFGSLVCVRSSSSSAAEARAGKAAKILETKIAIAGSTRVREAATAIP